MKQPFCLLLRLSSVLIPLSALFLCVPAFGHNGLRISGFGTATIDGVAAPSEWDHAGCASFMVNLPEGGTAPGSVCAMNDTQNLYLKISFARTTRNDLGGSISFEFDNQNAGGTYRTSGDIVGCNYGLWGGSEFFDVVRRGLTDSDVDTAAGGTSDGSGAFTYDGTAGTYELSHPLKSGDTNDFSLSPGGTVGFMLGLTIFSPTNVPAYTYYPTSNIAWADAFGDIVIASGGTSVPAYTARVLPPLPGDVQFSPAAVNSTGQVVGTSMSASGLNRAVRIQPDGTVSNIDSLLPADYVGRSYGGDINGSGAVTGFMGYDTPNNEFTFTGFFYAAGTVTNFPLGVQPMAINDQGQVAGFRYAYGGDRYAFVYRDGVMVDIGSLFGQCCAVASDINSLGHVVGFASGQYTNMPRAFVYVPGAGMGAVPLPPACVYSAAERVTDSYEIVGRCWTSMSIGPDNQLIFDYKNGVTRFLNFVPGSTEFGSVAVNKSGAIVANANVAGAPRAFFFPNATQPAIDLNALLPSGSEWVLTAAQSIADNGMITASGYRATAPGTPVALLLIPAGLDTTPPVLTLPSTITAEATNGSGAQVAFSVSATDAVDGPRQVTCSGSSGATFPLGKTTVTCSSTDKSTNTATGSFDIIVADTTPPTLNLPASFTAEATSSSGAQVSFTVSATDTVDESRQVTCSSPSGAIFPLGKTTVSCTSSDTHNNTAAGSFDITVVDTTPPVVTISGINVGGSYILGAVPIASCSTSDAVSGVQTNAVVSVTGGTPNQVGTFTATCSGGVDRAGNVAPPVTVTYSVKYVFNGFLPPVNVQRMTLKLGSTVPLKWQLTNSGGVFITQLSAVRSLQTTYDGACQGSSGDPMDAGASGDSGLRYDPLTNQFVYSWKTAGAQAGCYTFVLAFDDGSAHPLAIELK